MRDFKGMKRQRGRNRGGNTGGGGGGGGKPQHNINRAFDSNGPDGVKIRGNAQHVFEKYQQLARDASSGGDRVLAEGYLQHAEHYFRVLRAFQPQRPPSDFLGRESFTSGFDIDFEDDGNNNFTDDSAPAEGEPRAEGEGGEQQPYQNGQQNGQRDQNQPRDNQQRDGQQRDWGRERQERRDNQQQRFRDDRPRDERPRDEQRARDDRPRDERPRDDRPRDEQRPREDRPRDRDRFRGEGRFNERGDRPPREDREPRDNQPRDPMAIVEPETTPLTDTGHQLRSQDGALSPAPAFLQAPRAPEAASEDGEPRRPRRRRPARSLENDAGETPAETEEA